MSTSNVKKPLSASKIIKLKCIECCAGNAREANKCPAIVCPIYQWKQDKEAWKQAHPSKRGKKKLSEDEE